jgi:hypothetical protein
MKLTKEKVITIFGLLGAVSAMAHGSGVTVGHFAGTDFLTLIQGISTVVVGWAAGKDLTGATK